MSGRIISKFENIPGRNAQIKILFSHVMKVLQLRVSVRVLGCCLEAYKASGFGKAVTLFRKSPSQYTVFKRSACHKSNMLNLCSCGVLKKTKRSTTFLLISAHSI